MDELTKIARRPGSRVVVTNPRRARYGQVATVRVVEQDPEPQALSPVVLLTELLVELVV